MESTLESRQNTDHRRDVDSSYKAQLTEVEKQDAKGETLDEVDRSDDYNKARTVNNSPLLEATKNVKEVGRLKTGNFHPSSGADRPRVIKKLSGGKNRECIVLHPFPSNKNRWVLEFKYMGAIYLTKLTFYGESNVPVIIDISFHRSKQRQRRYNGEEVLQREATKESPPKLIKLLKSTGGIEREGAVNNEHEINLCLTLANTLEGSNSLEDRELEYFAYSPRAKQVYLQSSEDEALILQYPERRWSAKKVCLESSTSWNHCLAGERIEYAKKACFCYYCLAGESCVSSEESDNKLELFKVRTFQLGGGGGGDVASGIRGGGGNGGQGGNDGVGAGNR